MEWTFFYMFVVLKIPIVFAFWLVWYATREPEPEEAEEPRPGGGGGHSPRPSRPRPPRRGPHAVPPPRPPQRIRARGRQLPSAH